MKRVRSGTEAPTARAPAPQAGSLNEAGGDTGRPARSMAIIA